MYDGYFALGGQEIANTPRALGFQRSANCAVRWLDDRDDCETLAGALFDTDYVIENISDAPWYDEDNHERSSRILGLGVIEMSGIQDDTRQAAVQEKITEGSSLGRTRWAGRQVRITALLTALGQDALDAGMTWLRNSLSARMCGVHGTSCGLTDFEFFTDCPPGRGTAVESLSGGFGWGDFGTGPFGSGPEFVTSEVPESDADYLSRVNLLRRYLHSVKTISGPYVVRPLVSLRSPDVVGNIVEFTIGAEVPHIYAAPYEITPAPSAPTVVNDIPFNFAPKPRPYEQVTPKVVAIKQLSTNPSLETNANGWVSGFAPISGSSPSAFSAGGRVTGELAAVGVASYRAQILGDGATTAGGRALISTQQDVSLDDAQERVSLSVWAAAVSLGGATGAALVSVTAKVEWRTASSSLSTTTIASSTDSATIAGAAHSLVSQKPPSTATVARVVVEFVVDWSSSATPASNSDIRTYVDALGVTVP